MVIAREKTASSNDDKKSLPSNLMLSRDAETYKELPYLRSLLESEEFLSKLPYLRSANDEVNELPLLRSVKEEKNLPYLRNLEESKTLPYLRSLEEKRESKLLKTLYEAKKRESILLKRAINTCTSALLEKKRETALNAEKIGKISK